MKTVIFLPDDLFRRAEAAADRLQIPLNELYSAALIEYLERCETNNVTARLNEVYSEEPAKLDRPLKRAQFKALESESW